MKTEESKIKVSFTKEAPLDPNTSTNCTAKLPMIERSNSKPIQRPSVYQGRLPKPNRSSPSNCTNIKNPWVMRSAVVFAIGSIIVVFAALQGKTSADLKRTETNVESLENLVDVLRINIADLESRVQCATTDNGTDGRGRPCPAGRKGKIGFVKDKRKSDKTNASENPTSKSKNNKDRLDASATQAWSQTGSRATRRRQSSVYTCWGCAECPEWEDVETLYSGKVATLHSRSNPRVSSEYLCIPHRIKFISHKEIDSGLSLSPVKFGANITIFSYIDPKLCKNWGKKCEMLKKMKPELFVSLDNFQVPCSVCIREKRTATLVMPARNTCLPGWWKEYYGYLMTHHSGEGAHHICVNADASGVPGSNSTGTQGPTLQPVSYKCNGPYCSASSDSSSNREKALTCVVCSI
ncbi:uncharacterized protein [Montipora foliosa]|uniref:uncharacterized protein isoform X2 n=1 Tax=Montipora foliosa TaxID=591990 RepID=UPI0035F20ED5